jgi:DNA-binding MarR family transcriptional regulator
MTGYALRRAQLAVFADAINTLASLNLRLAQFSVLLVIARNPGRKQSEIAEALGIQRPNFVALMDGLNRRGLARRMPLVSDRRSYAVVLTESGEALLAEAQEALAEHEQRVHRHLRDGEHEALLRTLASINAAMADAGDE